MMNLCCEIGYSFAHKHGEELCGDYIDVSNNADGSATVVLADGLGSGVKANILSTLTAKMLSTMISNGIDLTDCVRTVAKTLPVCAVREIAYSTFTILKISANQREIDIFQYDNPNVILFRNGEHCEFPYTELHVDEKKILVSKIALCEGDQFFAMSDGCIHAGVGSLLNFGWLRKDIIQYMKPLFYSGLTAKTLSAVLLEKCAMLYGNQFGDDTSVCVLRVRKREVVNILIGPPSNHDDCQKMMALFFGKEGKHIVCGGTTSTLAAEYLNKPLITSLQYHVNDVPPIAMLEGVDLVTEGVLTVHKTVQYAKDFISENDDYKVWSCGKDGASQIARLLFEQASDINFFVGKAINPAHQNPQLPLTFNIKMQLIEELATCLEKMGKQIKVNYF